MNAVLRLSERYFISSGQKYGCPMISEPVSIRMSEHRRSRSAYSCDALLDKAFFFT